MRKLGLFNSQIDPSIKTIRELIENLRHAIAHFDIEVISENSENLIDFIEFKGSEKQPQVIAKIRSSEILPFLEYYANELLENLRKYAR